MATTNVIDFVMVLQRQREQQNGHAAYAGHYDPWRNRYREGIDGLSSTRQLWTSTGEVVPFVPTRSRPDREH